MTDELIKMVTARLTNEAVVGRTEIEARYPARKLASDAYVTRIAPSPTGFVHIGTVYAALLNERIAHQSGGTYLLRIEDTDKKREVEGGESQIVESLRLFGLQPDEGPASQASYGPYKQSERASIYVSYALELLKGGWAYPCFATPQELDANHALQTERKHRPGYYGQYALWRDKPAENVMVQLQDNTPFVLRLRSHGDHSRRLSFSDALKGAMSLPENDLDIPLIKSDGLPTYHLAHVVDDHLMRTSLVLRGEEWLPSTPLHIELATALAITPLQYAHFAAISILDNGNKRKLSKRKDTAADAASWLADGYPPSAIIEYLMTLANSNYEDWRKANPFTPFTKFPFSLKKLAMSRAPLLDFKKLTDVSRNVIAELSQPDFEHQLLEWLRLFDPELLQVFTLDPDYTSKVLTIEREGANRRKDLANWNQARSQYFYFFDALYQAAVNEAISSELAEVAVTDRQAACEAFLAKYDANDDQPTWLAKFRQAAADSGYAADTKAYQANPGNFKGSLSDFAKILRVLLTTSNRSPDLFSVMQIMGPDRVRTRLSS